jgi:hypothetical protein
VGQQHGPLRVPGGQLQQRRQAPADVAAGGGEPLADEVRDLLVRQRRQGSSRACA